jgi:hypothetical protein
MLRRGVALVLALGSTKSPPYPKTGSTFSLVSPLLRYVLESLYRYCFLWSISQLDCTSVWSTSAAYSICLRSGPGMALQYCPTTPEHFVQKTSARVHPSSER